MVKYVQKVAVFSLVLGLVFLLSCRKSDETIWDAVVLSTQKQSLVLMLSSSEVPTAGDYGLPVIDSMKNNLTNGVNGNRLFYLSLYPQVSDPLYNFAAEQFKFLYDVNGDNSLSTTPAFVSNTKNYNYDLDSLKSNLAEQATESQKISVGNVLRLKGNTLEMYIKMRYNDFYFNAHSLAVYIYDKEVVASQATISNGTVTNFKHKNVLSEFVTSLKGEVFQETVQYGHERELLYEYNIGDKNIDNIGVLTVVYRLDSNKNPKEVIALYSN